MFVRLAPTPNPSPVKREGLPECISPSLLYGGKGQGIGGNEFANSSNRENDPRYIVDVVQLNLAPGKQTTMEV